MNILLFGNNVYKKITTIITTNITESMRKIINQIALAIALNDVLNVSNIFELLVCLSFSGRSFCDDGGNNIRVGDGVEVLMFILFVQKQLFQAYTPGITSSTYTLNFQHCYRVQFTKIVPRNEFIR